MSKTYSVEPAMKKCITEREEWYNEELDLYMYVEVLWRWGRWYVTLDEGETIPNAGEKQYISVGQLGDDVEFDFTDDDCGRWFEPDMEPGEEYDALVEKIEEAWEEDFYMGIEDLGWEHVDTDYYIYGELNIEEVE